MKKKEKLSEFAKYVIENNLSLPLEKAWELNPDILNEKWDEKQTEENFKGYSKFVKYVFLNNKVRTLDYVKDRDDDCIIREEAEVVYTSSKKKEKKYKIGDIILVKNFRYPDGSLGTLHPFIIIDKLNLAVPIEHLSMIISSNVKKKKYPTNIFLSKDDKNNLDMDSIVKTDYIYHIHALQINGVTGSVSNDSVKLFKENYLKYK